MIPGWEGSIGPSRAQYGQPHVYARDITSGAGNCVCGRDVGASVHVQAAPGVPVPSRMRAGWGASLSSAAYYGEGPLIAFMRARLAEEKTAAEVATASPWRVDQRSPNVILESLPIDSVGVAGRRTDIDPVFTGQTSSRTRQQWEADARHIVIWQPARALRELEAKRDRLDQYRAAIAACQIAGADEYQSLRRHMDAARDVVLSDARVWIDHPDFMDGWA